MPRIVACMGTNRLEVLRGMLEQDPKNTFARYGLAMEFVNNGEHQQAQAEFDELLSLTPEYVPGYFHAGRNLEKLGRTDDAKAVYEKGITTATAAGDMHARSELQAALDMVGL
ncbi:MAG TPA: hypothetical protein VEQ63_14705 [Bryobacteraceae bacterium]|nr:hypothetical protein [Bryobacteraceae bacterium]